MFVKIQYNEYIIINSSINIKNKFQIIMKIVVFGLNRNVLELIDMLVDGGHEILSLIPPTEKKNSDYTKDRLFGKKKIKISILHTKNINELDFIKQIKNLKADLFVNWEHSQIFSKELLSCPRIGSLKFHRGLLPDARGFDPILGERLNGIETLGQTVHFMTNKIDKGKILMIIKSKHDLKNKNYNNKL